MSTCCNIDIQYYVLTEEVNSKIIIVSNIITIVITFTSTWLAAGIKLLIIPLAFVSSILVKNVEQFIQNKNDYETLEKILLRLGRDKKFQNSIKLILENQLEYLPKVRVRLNDELDIDKKI